MEEIPTQAYTSLLKFLLNLSVHDPTALKTSTTTLRAGNLRIRLSNDYFTIALINSKLRNKCAAPSREPNDSYNGGSPDGLFTGGGGSFPVSNGVRDAAGGGGDDQNEQNPDDGSAENGGGGSDGGRGPESNDDDERQEGDDAHLDVRKMLEARLEAWAAEARDPRCVCGSCGDQASCPHMPEIQQERWLTRLAHREDSFDLEVADLETWSAANPGRFLRIK